MGLNCRPAPGSGYASAFPSTSCLIPPRMAIRSAPLSPSIRALISGLASDRVSEDQASIATARSPLPPRDCPGCPHTRRSLRGRNCRPLRSTGRCRSESRRVSQGVATRRPIPFLHDPQGAQEQPVQQAPGSESACRPSNWQALHWCQSKDAHRARRAGFEYSCWGDAHPPAAAMGRSERHRSEASRIPCRARDNRRASEQLR
jgi:hypothetical protein